jgi:hypothetical protein
MLLNKPLTSFLIFLLFYSAPSLAWNKLTNSFDIKCVQISQAINCNYRTLNNEKITSINAKSDNIELKVTNNKSYPVTTEQTAILFLVDTSDPGRQNVIEKNKVQLKKILTTLKPHHKVGLASFDKSLNIRSPIGTSSFLLSKSVDELNASGKTTELYRNILEAMEQLNGYEAQRKVVVLFSDGQAEDKAYFHSDIIKMARKYGIVINSIGYPRSIALSVALQTIRRLSEETGGYFYETGMSYNLPDNEINKLFENIDNGGSFSVSLSELLHADKNFNSVTLSFTTQNSIKHIQMPVELKTEKKIAKDFRNTPDKVVSTAPQPVNNSSNKAPIQIITKQATPQPVNLWLWYGLPAAFIIIIIFILLTLFLLWRRPEQKTTSSNNEYRPYAYLISNDESQTRYPITRTICRIGRSKDNELHLDDSSISRRHAEIHRNNDGTFEIMDMNSTNGVYINNEKIGKAELHEGDVLEIGDFFLNFTQLASDYSLEESTVMQKTRAPVTH